MSEQDNGTQKVMLYKGVCITVEFVSPQGWRYVVVWTDKKGRTRTESDDIHYVTWQAARANGIARYQDVSGKRLEYR